MNGKLIPKAIEELIEEKQEKAELEYTVETKQTAREMLKTRLSRAKDGNLYARLLEENWGIDYDKNANDYRG